ncbi:hypothetical protein EYZ11_006576 [Aspergillus tanneri]|uniref:Uncharacterized protein n=1 Tax=Aspergillus tanneri TaxID=1220188 RepID=A0A4S3JF39_9EURO|nr:uncharacterized protein ATNIH1004_008191 [Aspergillus tanneri]KAA8643995.1 hypothetical protein ATNIH1004_008191 [Aspergillus tanneri]THC93929.1 hypothetical protein EYZ11_006576 [Aspergillus tanneri]
MHLVTLTAAFSILASLTFAAPPKPESWNASGFVGECEGSECAYYFEITANKTPRFETACAEYTREDYVPCADKAVEAKVTKEDSKWIIHVKHTWYEGEARYTAHGNNTIADKTEDFTIPVTEITGVA